MKKSLFLFLLSTWYLVLGTIFIPPPVYASYVLPYPSFMPGNKLYRVSRIIDTAKNYWYWGTIAQLKYHIGLSDKYLVESKTLFEYKQYLLATDALKRSDQELSNIVGLLDKGTTEGKDMKGQKQILSEAMRMHVMTLSNMKGQSPADFLWTPEKTDATQLSISTLIDSSMLLRQKISEEATKNE